MNTADLLLANLERLLSGPTSAETIRKLIFDLAIRGKLSIQSDKDEPASELIAKVIRTAQAEDRKFSAEPAVTEKPFEVPSGWEWVRLGNTGKIFNGTSASAGEKVRLSKTTDGLPFIATKDVGYGREPLCYENGLKVPHGDKDYKVAKTGAVLICAEGGSAGKKIGQTDRPICFGNKLYANETWDGIEPGYILSLYQSNFFYAEFKEKMAGIIGGIARSDFRSLRIPLPPLAEQRRIVAKVDELMALCDRLEAQLKERDAKQAALAKAALAKFSEDPTPENLQLLFHPLFSIATEDLQGVVRSLAAGGRLIARTSSWNKEKLGSLCVKIGSGSTPTGGKESYQTSGTPLIRSMNVHFDGIHDEGLAFLNDSQAEKLKNVTVAEGDVLLNITGASIGRVTVAPERIAGARVNQHVCIIRTQAKLTPRFLALVLASPEIQSVINNVQVGATREALNKSMIQDFDIPMPSVEEQNLTTEKAAVLLESCRLLEAQLEASRTTGEKLLEAMVAELTGA
jgi:type I restriction enzyme S subunit